MHILILNLLQQKKKICLVPPEIARRLTVLSATGICQGYSSNPGTSFNGYFLKENDRYYVVSSVDLRYTFCLTFYIMLKDI